MELIGKLGNKKFNVEIFYDIQTEIKEMSYFELGSYLLTNDIEKITILLREF